MQRPIHRVENYTKPFLVCFGVLLFMALFAIKVIYGFLFALLAGWSLDRFIVFRGRGRS
jgi:hypothetical protein